MVVKHCTRTSKNILPAEYKRYKNRNKSATYVNPIT